MLLFSRILCDNYIIQEKNVLQELKMTDTIRKNIIYITIYGLIMGLLTGYIRISSSYDSVRLPLYACIIIITTAALCFITRNITRGLKENKINISGVCCLIIYSGFIIRLLYIIFSTIYMRQNDVLTLEESGHLGYISYVYVFLKPPTPGAGWEFTQPPLWYYICAIWLRVGIKFTKNFDMLLESLQILSLAFSVGIMIVSDLIASELKLTGRARITACIFGAFYPYMIFMSGAINNDCLATFLSMLTILFAIKWISSYRNMHLLLTSVFFGLSLSAKFSSIVLGPALAAVIIITFIKKERNLNSIPKYLLFALISSVTGLSWPIYSRVFYDIPFGYINSASERHAGDHAVWELLFSFKNQLNHYYLNVVEGHADYDFNIFSTIIKSGTYGVDNFMSDNPLLTTAGIILLWVNIILAVSLVIGSLRWIFESGRSVEVRVFSALTIWVSVILLYGRAVYSAYTCNMELRFMLPAFLLMIPTAAGAFYDETGKTGSLRICKLFTPVVLIMSLLSIFMWLMVLTIHDYESIRMIIG